MLPSNVDPNYSYKQLPASDPCRRWATNNRWVTPLPVHAEGTSTTPRNSAKCGESLPPGARFCIECGPAAPPDERPVSVRLQEDLGQNYQVLGELGHGDRGPLQADDGSASRPERTTSRCTSEAGLCHQQVPRERNRKPLGTHARCNEGASPALILTPTPNTFLK
jgi:hypothetical protein